MFLSKLAVNTASREFRRDYADVHDMHRTLLSVLPEVHGGAPARQEHGVLWRLDPADRGFVLLVQSRIEPDWSELPEGYLAAPAEVRSLRPVLDAVRPGRLLAFRLVGNPTRSLPPAPVADAGPSGKKFGRGKRVPVHDPDGQIAWLVGRGERHGFVIPAGADGAPAVAVSPMPSLLGSKSLDPGESRRRNKITVSPARFDGRLVVTDPERFTEALREGVGRAKAYGCGLLSVAEALA